MKKLLKAIIAFDVVIVLLLNLAGCAGTIYVNGFWDGWANIQEWYSPFNYATHILNAVLLSPAGIAVWAKGKIEDREFQRETHGY